MKLPEVPINPVEIKLHKEQRNKFIDNFDKRVFGKRTFNIIYGSRFLGKTVMISNLVKNFYLGRKGFDSILVLTPSIRDPAWNLIKDRKRVTITKICNNEFLMDILESQEESIEEFGEENTRELLLVIDDYASQGKCLKALEEIAIRGRHSCLTVIITSQYSKLLSPTIRQNANGVVLYKMSEKELADLADEGLKTLIDKKDFIDWVMRHTSNPRQFVYINLRDPDRIFNIGFSDISK